MSLPSCECQYVLVRGAHVCICTYTCQVSISELSLRVTLKNKTSSAFSWHSIRMLFLLYVLVAHFYKSKLFFVTGFKVATVGLNGSIGSYTLDPSSHLGVPLVVHAYFQEDATLRWPAPSYSLIPVKVKSSICCNTVCIIIAACELTISRASFTLACIEIDFQNSIRYLRSPSILQHVMLCGSCRLF